MAKNLFAILVVLSATTGAGAQVVVGPLPPDPTPVVRIGTAATPFAPGGRGYPVTITMTNLGPRRGLVVNQPTDVTVWALMTEGNVVSVSADSGYTCNVASDQFLCSGSLPFQGTVTIDARVLPASCGRTIEMDLLDFLPANNLWNGFAVTKVFMEGAPCPSP